MKFREYDAHDADDYTVADERNDEKRWRRNKRSGGKHLRDSFEGRDRDHGEWY